MARDDVPAAVNLLERGVALLPQTSSSRGFALLELAIALMRSGAFAAAEGALEQALELGRAEGDRRLELRTLIEREFFRIFTNVQTPVEEITRLAEEAIPALEALGDDAGVAKAWWLLSEPPVNACRWGERAAALERALEYAKRAGDAREAARVAALLMQAIQLGPTPVNAAIDRAQLFLRESEDDRLLTASILSSLGALLAMRGEFDDARAQWARAQALWDELGMATQPRSPGHRRLDDRAAGRERRSRRATSFVAPARCSKRSETCISQRRSPPTSRQLSHRGTASKRPRRPCSSRSRAPRRTTSSRRSCGALQARRFRRSEQLAREAVELAAPTDFLDLQATAQLALARVLHAAGSAEAAGVAAEAQAVFERKGNLVGAGWASSLLKTLPPPE